MSPSRLPWILGVAAVISSAFSASGVEAQEGGPPPQPRVPSLLQLASPSPSDDHSAAPVVVAVRRQGSIEIDGRLSEEAWRDAPASGGFFIQTEPSEGEPSPERTDVYVVYDDVALYIGARLWDSTGDVRKRLGRRDQMLQDSDWFDVMLDSHHDHLNAYQFSVNPAGVKRDQITTGTGRSDGSWDAVWAAATSIDAEGWSVEMRIPFSQLRFSSDEVQTWGIQLQRRINRLQEVSVFSFTPRGQRAGVARYGHLIGLENLQTGKRLEVVPYLLGRGEFVRAAVDDPFRGASVYGRGYGADALYRVTTSMTLTATVNPDFGQVEVDPAVVNLTAFETSFQERRPFFVEGSSIFRFGVGASGGPGGGGGGGPQLLYSRRVGRSPQGSVPSNAVFSDVPTASTIYGAAKLTGRTQSGWTVGVLQAVTAQETASWIDGLDRPGESVVEPLTNYLIGRALKDFRSGQTQVGVLGTAVNRRMDDDGLASLLRSNAYTGGVDFSHEILNRTWSVEGYAALSQVAGSAAAMIRTQRQSSRYFQRPDAGHVAVDSMMTMLRGYTARLEVGKRAGLHWRGEAGVTTTSPGFEINDMGFQTGVDRVSTNLNVTYVQSTPHGWFRSYRISTGPNVFWNHDGDFLGGRANLGLNGQLNNFWGANLNFNKRIVGYDDRLTRGGPLMRDRAGQSLGGMINTDTRRKVTGRLNANYNWGVGEGVERRVGGGVTIRPVENWTLSLGPSVSSNLTYAQYVTTISDATAVATYGRRYIFTGLEQVTMSMDTRLNVNFTPDLSLELFAQPLISSGDYEALRELRAPRTYEFLEYGKDIGTISYDPETRMFTVDPDAGGSAARFTVRNRDFNRRSLRGNAVARWEYRPGSTLYLVWQQSRSEVEGHGDFSFRRDAGGLFDARPDNIFVVKFNYWFNL
jgi:hypothetical protein